MSLIFGPHKNLTKKSALIEDSEFGDEMAELSEAMLALMSALGGVGLAGVQIGIPKRIIVANVGEGNIVLINPVIKSVSDEESELEEGCLSFPLKTFRIKRPSEVTVNFRLPDGRESEETFSGMEAAVVQHEIDHLDGITVFSKVSRLKRDLYSRKFKKFRRNIGK
jgi:peptide deformylase